MANDKTTTDLVNQVKRLHLTLLTIEKTLNRSSLPEHDALLKFFDIQKDIEQGMFSSDLKPNPLNSSDPQFSLPTSEDLRKHTDDQLRDLWREYSDPRNYVVREDPDDYKSSIEYWMPTDIRLACILLVQDEIARRRQKFYQKWTYILAGLSIAIALTALLNAVLPVNQIVEIVAAIRALF